MCNELGDENFFNCRWEHFWCDPKNFNVRELIKGSFSNPIVVYSIPYITFSQPNDTLISLSEGIPDCWAKYLTHNLKFFRGYLRNNDLMHKECVDIVPQLRKKYRLYIGQGIPNPWISYSYIDEFEIVSPRDLSVENTEKYLCHLSHCKHLKKNLKKEPCIWFKKKYLFECPDECDPGSYLYLHKNCNCKNTKTTDCNKNCRCVEFLKGAILKQKNKQTEGESLEFSVSSNNSDLRVENEDQNLKVNTRTQSCEQIRNQKAYNDSSRSKKSANERLLKSKHRNNVLSKKHSNVCFCPYVKSFYLRKIPRKSNAGKNISKPLSSSKVIQAEIQPMKISKTSQTENAESKTRIKCMCSNNKCVHYSTYQFKTPWVKSDCPAAHSASCLCFPLGCPQNPAFICPCFFSNNFLHHNFNKPKSKTKKELIKKKQRKEKETYDESNVEHKINQNPPKPDEKFNFKQQKLRNINDDDLKSSRNIYYVSKHPKTFYHLKYLTDENLKYYLQQEETFPNILSNKVTNSLNHSGSKLINFCRKDNSFYNLRPDKFEPEKLKTYSSCLPRHFESPFINSKTSFQENNLLNYNARRFNYSDQATMTKTSNNDSINKDKSFKERVKSGESRTYGLGINRVFSAKAMRKRRRLLTNRKRRKKLAASGRVSFLEYQALLNKLQKGPVLINKEVQVEETASDCFNLKKTLFPTLETLNSNKSSNLKLRNNILNSEHITVGTWKKTDEEILSRNSNKFAGNAYEGFLKQPLRSELQFDGVFEKISCNSGSSWSSTALKNIVNDLLMDKKCQE